jgi:hypothetical protein
MFSYYKKYKLYLHTNSGIKCWYDISNLSFEPYSLQLIYVILSFKIGSIRFSSLYVNIIIALDKSKLIP